MTPGLIEWAFRVDRAQPGPGYARDISEKRIDDRYPQFRLANVQPGDRLPDQHPLDFRRALEEGEDRRQIRGGGMSVVSA